MGVPGFFFAILASRLREPRQRPPAPIATTVRRWLERGWRQAMQYGKPLIGLALVGAVLSGLLDLFAGLHPGIETAGFAACVSAGIIWTGVRLGAPPRRGPPRGAGGGGAAFGGVLPAAAARVPPPAATWG